MRLENYLKGYFKKGSKVPTKNDRQWAEGFSALEKGKELYFDKDRQGALSCFDRAIALGFKDQAVYGLRAGCLQILGFHLDAIDDFDIAISLITEDSNLYFMRSISKRTTGDLAGGITDLEEAIRLSKLDNQDTRIANQWAKETGWESATAFYEMELKSAKNKFDHENSDTMKRFKEVKGKIEAMKAGGESLDINLSKEVESVRWRRKP